jgi:hypothetical protein
LKHTGMTLRDSATGDAHGKAIPAQVSMPTAPSRAP